MEICAEFENKVSAFLEFASSDSIFLAAVSGGADSMAILAALCALGDSGIIRKDALFCLHVEHALRPAKESLGDADFVRTFCQSQEIECRVKHILPGKIESFARKKGTGIEAAARHFRYRALLREAGRLGKNTLILAGHTKDDLLETALMRVLRGAGPAGLAAMQKRNEQLTEDNEQRTGRTVILRPLLSMTRADVINYLEAKKIPWREDSSNADEKFLRNKIRRLLVPLLNESFPSWKSGVSSMAETQFLASGFLVREAKQRVTWKIINKPQNSKTSPIIICNYEAKNSSCLYTDEENFFAQPQIIREEAVFHGINTLSLLRKRSGKPRRKKISEKSVKRSVIRKFCEGKIAAAGLGKFRIFRENGQILLSRVRKEFFECGVSRLIIGQRLDNL